MANNTLRHLLSIAVLTAVLLSLVPHTSQSQSQTTSDGRLTIAIPPGWQPFNQLGAEFAYQFPGPDPLIFFVISERKPLKSVFNDIRKEAEDPITQNFSSGTGWNGTKVSVRRPLSSPGTFIFQYYYLFPKGRTTYALVFTTGICQDQQTPEAMFDAIARTAHHK